MTAVIVGHDGAGWLSHGIDALLEQTRPAQRVVAVDTGSRDRSGSVLAAKLGQGAVFGMDRATGYAAAVRRALQHRAATAEVPASQSRGRPDQVEWIWLLHDDCEPAPDALEQLLRGAAETPTAAVLGPKLKDWSNRDVILEAGITLDAVGRRVTGIEPREIDQGQHDGDRDVLAVSSAGMLVRRDVWDRVGGFDPGMTMFGEDIDLCWRIHAAGFRVRVITDAVVYHALAATRGRRPISVGRRARLLDRRHGLLTLLGNLPTGPMLVSLVSNLTISLMRTLFYVVAKRGTAALDEAAAVAAIVGHPLRFAHARRMRARGRRAAYARVRADLQPGRSIRRMVEFAALVLSPSGGPDPVAGHAATDDPTDDDSLLIDTGFLQRFVTRPGVLLVFGLIVVAAVAERALIGGGPLGGGALLPAWEGASQLWGEVFQAFHPAGIGSASAAPPSAAFVALLATVLVGKTWLAVDVLLLGSVPLAGVTALLALRRVTTSAAVRVWAAGAYALLPVAFGAIAAGRLGSAVAFVLIPLIGLLAARMFTEPARLARRAAWATGLVLTVAAAFVPLLWPMAIAGAVVAAVIARRLERGRLINLAIAVLIPPLLLLPWMMQLLAHPSALLLEAGVQLPGLATPALAARSVLLLSPGGPGLPPYWVSGAIVLAGLVALLATRGRTLIVSGWCAALLGFGTALAISGMTVTPAGGQPMTPWPGPALAVAAAGLLLAAATAADGLARSLSSTGRKGTRRFVGGRGLAAALLGLAALSAPVLAAGYWLANGVSGPIGATASEVIPALVPVSGGAGRQLRTLVLSSEHGHISYVLLRTDSPEFTDPGLVPVAAAQGALNQAVAALVAPGGGEAANQSQLLARFDIGFVLMRAPVNAQLAGQLDAVAGLTGVSMTSAFDLWRLSTLPSRVSLVEPDGAVIPIDSGPVDVSNVKAPAAGGTLELAEPAGGWRASLDGHPLQSVSSPAGSWAQAFRLPPGGGTLSIGRVGLVHGLVTALELLAFVLVAILALPGVRTAAEIEAASAAGAATAAELDEEEPEHQPAGSGRQAGQGRRRAGSGKRHAGRRGARPLPSAEEPAMPLPVRRPGVIRAGRAGAGRAAADGAELADAAGAGVQASSLDGSPRAAWPAGQPASRFISGPPGPPVYSDDSGELTRVTDLSPSGSRFDTGPGRAGLSPSGSRFDTGPGRAGLSPSGSRFDTEPGRRTSSARARFDAEPGDGAPPVRGREAEPADQEAAPRRRGLLSAKRRPAEKGPAEKPPRRRHSRTGGSAADQAIDPVEGLEAYQLRPAASSSEQFDESGYESDYRQGSSRRAGPGHGAEPGYGDQGWDLGRDVPRTAQPAPGRRISGEWGRQQQSSGWPASDQEARRPDESGWSGRGQQSRQYRQDYPPVPQPGRGDEQNWPGQADELEALPPVEEVHHDWPRRGDRSRRGWIAPDDEADGETW